MKYRFKHVVEYAALRFVECLVVILPYRLALTFGWLIAFVAFYVFRFRRTEAISRIRQVFGDTLTPCKIRGIAWVAFRNLIFNLIEIMRMRKLTRPWIDRHIEYSTIDKLKPLIASGQGGLLVIPHMGNWDIAGVATQLLGYPVFFIAARQKNPLTDDYLNRMRSITGIDVVLRDSTVFINVVRQLKKGKILAILPDLRAPVKSLSIRFLGQNANLGEGMAAFARLANVPVFPAIVTRKGWTRHEWSVGDPIYPDLSLDKDEDFNRMTQQVMDIFDQAIRKHPEQYFWFNKRWVLDPLKENVAEKLS